ncbi:MAG: Flp family type IVb pilin [Nocardioidaceae bacterium]|nr:Flp family type IVb pilin [Nocardioidaceae bacterium]
MLRVYVGAPRRDEKGASAVEYGLLVALIAAVIVLAVTALGGTLNGIFEDTNDAING